MIDVSFYGSVCIPEYLVCALSVHGRLRNAVVAFDLMTQLLFISMIELSVVNFDIFATTFSNNKTVTPLKI